MCDIFLKKNFGGHDLFVGDFWLCQSWISPYLHIFYCLYATESSHTCEHALVGLESGMYRAAASEHEATQTLYRVIARL